MNSWLGLVVMVVLLAVNGFFVGAEFAVTASRRAEIEPLVKAGKRGASAALFAVEHVSEMLATCQLGITLASTGAGGGGRAGLGATIDPSGRVDRGTCGHGACCSGVDSAADSAVSACGGG
ncbi:hypothetical protein HMPREF9278_2087 [Mobiluncus mulieris FB024-16]|nr:hypothetical protein HMPREF9278_2087 [Mobiluncus mulieris FB024-16]